MRRTPTNNQPAYITKISELIDQLTKLRKSEEVAIDEIRILLDQHVKTSREQGAIEAFDFSYRTYRILKCICRINTVADILKFRQDNWCKVYGLGPSTAREIERKMAEIGHPEFKIELKPNVKKEIF